MQHGLGGPSSERGHSERYGVARVQLYGGNNLDTFGFPPKSITNTGSISRESNEQSMLLLHILTTMLGPQDIQIEKLVFGIQDYISKLI